MKILPIKKLLDDDRDLLVSIYNKNFPLSRWSKKYFFTFLLDSPRSFFGFYIKQDENIIGLALGRLIPQDISIFCLSALWVDKRFRGQELGKKLVQKIISVIANKRSVGKIILHFRDSNNLEKYYSRLGFSGHKITGAYSNGEPKHYMELNLN